MMKVPRCRLPRAGGQRGQGFDMLKHFLFRLFEWSGLNALWAFANRHQIIILRYHGVLPDEATRPDWLTAGPLPRSEFVRQLETLRRRYRVISLDEALAIIARRTPPRPYSVVLTFDDGYRNNSTVAYPVLREFAMSATIFLVTDFVDGRRPLWFDRLESALARSDGNQISVSVGEGRQEYRTDSHRAKVATFRSLLRVFKRMDVADIEPILDDIEAQTHQQLQDGWLDDERTAPLTWEQIREMERGQITFGSHTASHQILPVVPPERARIELRNARSVIEQRLGRSCHLFAYPNGDFTETSERLLREDGCQCALTTVPGTVRRGDNPLALRRFAAARPRDPDKFLAELSGLLPWLLGVRARLRRALFPVTLRQEPRARHAALP
jgi:peptidoglycan/xylan/chitin deacetylase (PgdA/CDA1 family)